MNELVKYKNCEYFMPFLFCNDIFVPVLQKLLGSEMSSIKYIYGSPYCEWGIGSRSAIFKLDNLNLIEKYFTKLKNEYNVIPALTFTNLNAKETLNDEYSNNLLDLAYSLNSRFIVAADELYNHIKSRYPNAKIHCSVVMPSTKIIEEKNFDETKFYNKMLDKCEVVVIRPEYTMDNLDKLDKLLSDISRVEVLINQICHYNCPYHREHYNFLAQLDKCSSRKNVKYHTDDNPEEFSLCPKFKKGYRSVHLTSQQIEKIVDTGIKKLKIQGRSLLFNQLFDELYENFFNNKYSKEELRSKTDKICAEMIKNDRKTALFLSL